MDLHAVILCGSGKALLPFLAVKSTGQPKAVLPIANKPMIEYVLEWCDQAPFGQVTVVVEPEAADAVKRAVDDYGASRRDADVALVVAPVSVVLQKAGTLTGLVFLLLAPTTDFVVLPCDLVTDVPPAVFVEAFRNRPAGQLAVTVGYHNNVETLDAKSFSPNYTVYAHTSRSPYAKVLLDLFSQELVTTSKKLQLRNHLVWRHPKAVVLRTLLDGFVCFCAKEMVAAVASDVRDADHKLFTKVLRDLARRLWRYKLPRESVGLFVLPRECQFLRANTVAAWMEANRWVMKERVRKAALEGELVVPTAGVGADCLVGLNTTLHERATVKQRSVIGLGVSIGRRARITALVVLDNAVVEDDAVLENTIVGTGASIQTKARLANCQVEGQMVVPKGSQIKGETLLLILLDGIADMDDSDSGLLSGTDRDDWDEGEWEDDGLFG